MSYESDIPNVIDDIDEATIQALNEIGFMVEGAARTLAPTDKGRLRQSITHAVEGEKVYIGSTVKYAPFVEDGTGIHNPKGRKTPWRYKDDSGNWHYTTGQKAQPFLKPAFINNLKKITKIAEVEFNGIDK